MVFPAPFGPEEAEDLAALDAEAHVVYGSEAAVPLREVLDLDHVVTSFQWWDGTDRAVPTENAIRTMEKCVAPIP